MMIGQGGGGGGYGIQGNYGINPAEVSKKSYSFMLFQFSLFNNIRLFGDT